MSDEKTLISKAFQIFMQDAPKQAEAWGTLVQELAKASALDAKTAALAYLAVLAALGARKRHTISCQISQEGRRLPGRGDQCSPGRFASRRTPRHPSAARSCRSVRFGLSI